MERLSSNNKKLSNRSRNFSHLESESSPSLVLLVRVVVVVELAAVAPVLVGILGHRGAAGLAVGEVVTVARGLKERKQPFFKDIFSW